MSYSDLPRASTGLDFSRNHFIGHICRLKAYIVITFEAEKINLSGISPAKRSRSGPNTYSRGDNVQGILGAIGPFWAKWGLGRVPRSPSFFVW